MAEPNINCYKNGKIYTIRSFQTDKYYIGSSCNTLFKRFSQHKRNYKKFLNNKYNYVSSFDIIKYDDCYIELLENYSCNSRDELNKKEGEFIRLYKNNIVNKRIEFRSSKEYRNDNKEIIKEKNKEYRTENKQILAKKQKEYYQNNKEKILTKIICECGCEIAYKNLNRHKKSQKHINMLSKKE